jgi:hypothetical protein
MKVESEDPRTRTFDFKPHQISVADAALLLDCSVNDITALIRLGHLEAEGKRPYKVDVNSVVEYKRTMAGSEEEE